MISAHLRLGLVGVILVMAFAVAGVGHGVAGASALRDPGPAAAAAPVASGTHNADAVVPRRVGKISVAERDGVRLPDLTAILAAAAVAAAAVPRLRCRRHRLSTFSPVLGAQAVRRRGPPILSLV